MLLHENYEVIARAAQDPQKVNTRTGTSMATFSLAVNRPGKDEKGNKNVVFKRFKALGTVADRVLEQVRKGAIVFVEQSEPQVHSYEKDGQTVEYEEYLVREFSVDNYAARAEGAAPAAGGPVGPASGASIGGQQAPRGFRTQANPTGKQGPHNSDKPIFNEDEDSIPY